MAKARGFQFFGKMAVDLYEKGERDPEKYKQLKEDFKKTLTTPNDSGIISLKE